jgi:S-adenosylmethionine synthetase
MAEKTETNPKGSGAPLGNQNSSKSNRLFGETIKRIAIQSEGDYNRAIAQALIDKAMSGDISAIKEYADRVDGKVVQQIDQNTELSGEVAYTWKK